MPDSHGAHGPLCWAVACATHEGETLSGDTFVVRQLPGDVLLLAVVDGLGHGPDAAVAAAAAERVLREAEFESITEALERAHAAIRHTRGVVMTLVSVDLSSGAMEWVGVGNVDGVIVRGERDARSESVMLSGGVVGYQLPRLRSRRLELAPGDMVVLVTDGIGPNFATSLIRTDSPAGNANRVLRQHGRGTDDALVLVACWNQDGAA